MSDITQTARKMAESTAGIANISGGKLNAIPTRAARAAIAVVATNKLRVRLLIF